MIPGRARNQQFFFFAGRISYLTHEISSSDERASLFPAARPSPRELNSSPLAPTLLLAVAERSRAGWQKWTLGFGFSWKNKAVIVAWPFPRACPEAWLLVEGAEPDGHIPRARDTLGGGGEPLPTCRARAVSVRSDSADSQSGFSSQGALGFLWETEDIPEPRAGCEDAPSHPSSLGSPVVQRNKIRSHLN